MNRPEPTLSADASVRSTDTDALVSRSSAASLGYLSDSYAPLFLPPALRRSSEKRPPLINIGTHARTWAIDQLVEQFLSADEGEGRKGKGRQVLSLGAGTDTRYWRARAKAGQEGREWSCRRWVEVDFEEATGTKARTIVGKSVLKEVLGAEVKIRTFCLGPKGREGGVEAHLGAVVRPSQCMVGPVSPPSRTLLYQEISDLSIPSRLSSCHHHPPTRLLRCWTRPSLRSSSQNASLSTSRPPQPPESSRGLPRPSRRARRSPMTPSGCKTALARS